MLFVMHSEMFFEYFLVNEDYKIIKDAQIIVVSNSIRKRRPKEDNIICLNHRGITISFYSDKRRYKEKL